MCVHVFALIHSCLRVTNVCVSFSQCVCLRASSSHIPLGWSQCFGGDPAAWTIECVRTVRETKEEKWAKLAFWGKPGIMLHTQKNNASPPATLDLGGNFLLWFAQKSLYISVTGVVCLWHIYRCTPPSRTPSCEPRGRLLEASFWFRFSNQRWSSSDPESLCLGGLITQELRCGYRSWNLYLLCACVNLPHWSTHEFIMNKSAGCARQGHHSSFLLFSADLE